MTRTQKNNASIEVVFPAEATPEEMRNTHE